MSLRYRTSSGVETYQIHSRFLPASRLCPPVPEKKISQLLERIMMDMAETVLERFSLDMFSFAIEGNSFYFIISTEGGEMRVTQALCYIRSAVAERFNRAVDRKGPFWSGKNLCEKLNT